MKKTLKFSLVFLIIAFSCSENKNLEGKRLYDLRCLNCHQEQGQGVGALIPPIDPTFLNQNRSKLACIIQNGIKGDLTIQNKKYNKEMPPTEGLKDADLVNILNYIGQNFGNDMPTFTIKEVQESLNTCEK